MSSHRKSWYPTIFCCKSTNNQSIVDSESRLVTGESEGYTSTKSERDEVFPLVNTKEPQVWKCDYVSIPFYVQCFIAKVSWYTMMGTGLEFAPLTMYYCLMANPDVELKTTCLYCMLFQIFSIGFIHLRSATESNIVLSPRLLDLGLLTFYTVLFMICSVSNDSQRIVLVWSNVLIMAAFFVLISVGCSVGSPFFLPYAIETGIPEELATQPFLIYTLSKASMEWGWAFFTIALVGRIIFRMSAFFERYITITF